MTRAFLAGAALLAGAHVRSAAAQGGEHDDAMAIPRFAPHDGPEVLLPRPLALSEARRIKRIFQLQAQGDVLSAVAETAQLTDFTLLGHILADRYLRPDWRGLAADLALWQARYADLPDAPALHAKLSLLNHGSAMGPAPEPTPALATPEPDAAGVQRSPYLDRAVRDRIKAGQFDAAAHLVARTRGIDRAYAALLQAEIAQGLFFQNRDGEALAAADAAYRRGGGKPALAAYVAGLAAWRLERPDAARAWFEVAWRAPDGDDWLRAGSAYWAARARLRTGGSNGYALWMHRAAREPETFYGQIARQTLGVRPDRPQPPERLTLGLADVELIDSTAAGHRAFALLQVGQPARAEAELRRLWGNVRDPSGAGSTTHDMLGLGRAIVLVAQQAGLSDFALALAAVLPELKQSGVLPLPRLRPAGGFKVDPALVYGLTRLESNFDAAIASPAGALGLMQIMPVTASYLGEGRPLAYATLVRRLRDPGANLDMGQRYLLFLADALDGNLVRMIAAYNSGVGSFARWNGEIRHMDDPLLFIESIPNPQTRAYVFRGFTYTWLYAAQLQVATPSLDDLAAGVWPRFTSPAAGRVLSQRLH